MERLRKAREAYELGCRLQKAIERARMLHPWVSVEHELRALLEEVVELSTEVRRYLDGYDNLQEMIGEAIDCAVVAIRIAQRK